MFRFAAAARFAGFAALVLLTSTACAATGGVRVEGRAADVAPTTSANSSGGTPAVSMDAVKVLRDDAGVNQDIKDQLTPCFDGRYGVDIQYGDLTGDDVPEALVNVTSCVAAERTSKPGASIDLESRLGGFVYQWRDNNRWERIFAVQERGSSVQAYDLPALLVLRMVYRPGDRSCCPTGDEVDTYKWNGTALVGSGTR
ncbi:hypothetical protein [Amycolatopsis anabasis]|uniref:hypothetical protein n=1 Tax=Amycolatopsis anabasis TaxID=1840409 RepID=UPI00131DE4AF|nr:hypothetical protein [Amycolatopsis anabasis]